MHKKGLPGHQNPRSPYCKLGSICQDDAGGLSWLGLQCAQLVSIQKLIWCLPAAQALAQINHWRLHISTTHRLALTGLARRQQLLHPTQQEGASSIDCDHSAALLLLVLQRGWRNLLYMRQSLKITGRAGHDTIHGIMVLTSCCVSQPLPQTPTAKLSDATQTRQGRRARPMTAG